jgi:pSer/pThr/pTyr-binding forkhead associated (FHA) protein
MDLEADGTYVLTDLNSTGGTYVNDARIQSQHLESGDVIHLSGLQGVFLYTAGPKVPMDEGGTIVGGRAAVARQMAALAAAGPKVKLVITLADGSVVEHQLEKDVTIGRAAENDIVIPDQHVSSRHARLLRSGGMYEIVDLGSTGGTWVDGKQVESALLRNGSSIVFSTVHARYEIEKQ